VSDDPNQATPVAGGPIGPDGTPFDSARWDSYVQHTKAEKAELKQQLEQANGVWEDEQAALARFREKFPHLVQDEEPAPETPDYEEDDPIAPLRSDLDELKEWKQQRDAERAQATFDREVVEEAGERSLSRQAKDWILQETVRLGNGRENLAKATKAWLEFEDELRGPQRKPAPTPPQPGKAAEVDPNASKDPEQRRRARRAQMAAQIEAMQ
jgi:hypothetical protein